MDARLRGLRGLVHDAIEVITNLVQETQEAEAKRVVGALSHAEPVGEAAQRVDGVRNAVASLVFDSVRLVNRGVEELTDLAEDALARALPEGAAKRLKERLTPGAGERLVGLADDAQSALNALVGDFLAARANGLAIDMSFAHAGRPFALTREELARVVPEPTPKLAIFVHGLGCNESCWRIGALGLYGDEQANYGRFLARDLGFTPLFLRYNTGRHISENGRELAALVEQLLDVYPVAPREIALIGHSMGGLLVRSAAHYARAEQRRWVNALKHVVCIGSPHLGAPLEKAGNLLSSLLGMVDVAGTQVPRKVLNARSAGIKDLRFGYIADEDWTGKDPDAFLADNARDVPLLDGVSYAFVAASMLAQGERGGGFIGDMMVRLPSATGRGEGTRQLEFQLGHVVYGVSHIGLLNHPDVYTQLRAFLEDKLGTPLDPSGDPQAER
ncbi:MAG TPA: alpha/beta fold hydrolase [Polyangiales bacterium]